MTPVRLEPAALLLGLKSSTLPLSHCALFQYNVFIRFRTVFESLLFGAFCSTFGLYYATTWKYNEIHVYYIHDYCTVKPVLSDHSKKTPKKVFKANNHLMQVKSIAELLTCIMLPHSFKIFVLSISEWLL